MFFLWEILYNAAMKQNLRIPGPTPLPSAVLKAISKQVINHRGQTYEIIQKRIIENLRHFFQTHADIFLLTSSGTGGFDAAITNFCSVGDTIFSFSCGPFGDRFADAAEAYNTDVRRITFPMGAPIDIEVVRRTLAQHDNALRAVILTHNETSTGTINDIKAIAPIVKSHMKEPLLIVDAVSSLGAIDLPMDVLGIDVLITASQKAWMAPPGICMIAVSEKAWQCSVYSDIPNYYFDLKRMSEFAQKNQTPATPAVSTLVGLDASLQLMLKEGRENIFKRHIELMHYFRKEVRRIGLELFVADEHASPTVTSIKVPGGIDGKQWMKTLEEKYGLIVAGGMGELSGKIIRIAHMGNVTKHDLDATIYSLKRSLQQFFPSEHRNTRN